MPPHPWGVSRRSGKHSGNSERPANSDSRAFESLDDELANAHLETASLGDHLAVYQLLSAVFHAPSRDAFFSSLEDPFYEPCDRLVVRRDSRLLGQVQLVARTMHFGRLACPLALLAGLSTFPEYRGRGFGRALLRAAERTLADEEVPLGLLSTRIPQFFAPSGWAVCGRHSHGRANTRSLLAQLSARGISPGEGSLNIRPWRQVELPALMRLYAANTATATGALERTEAYWRWLISRQGFDQLYIALEGPQRYSLDLVDAPIVGYVVTKDDRVLELMAARGKPEVAEQLLARACHDAIERDCHCVQLHAPPDDPLHGLFESAAGRLSQHEVHQGEVQMARIANPRAFLRFLGPELQRRAIAAELDLPCELGLQIGADKYQLGVSRRGVKITRSKLGRSYLRMSRAEFTRLALGHMDVAEAAAQDRVQVSTRLALESGRVLFPRLPLWRSPWDEIYL
ncbi:MAG TPA: GNAT family N-acetyltransferase [Pirellulales bacterium]|nr:GNAT family N-acetyltransferase [Pirellulales bacterium]